VALSTIKQTNKQKNKQANKQTNKQTVFYIFSIGFWSDVSFVFHFITPL
jgi:hypothetical protein